MKELEITIMIDSEGNWTVCKSEDEADTYIDDAVGAIAMYHLNLKVPTPQPKVLTASLPAPKTEPAELVITEA